MPDYNPIGSPNLGIIFDGFGQPGPSYTDSEFNDRDTAVLGTDYVAMDVISGIPDTPRPWVSRTQGMTLFVEISGTHAAETITIKVEARKDEDRPWNLMQTVRQDTGLPAAEHVIDFTDGTSVMLDTSSEFATGQIQVSVKSSTGDLLEGDSVIVRGEAS